MALALDLCARAPRSGALDEEVHRALERVPAFRGLCPEDRLTLSARASLETLSRGTVLFRQGDDDARMFCLIEGAVDMVATDGRSHRVESGESGGRLIGRLRPSLHTATAAGPARVLRVDTEGMDGWHAGAEPAGAIELREFEPGPVTGAADPEGEDALAGFDDHALPSLPAVALRTRELIDRGDANARTIAGVLVNDPAIAAKLMRAANSPVFYGAEPVADCRRAIVRLGLATARQLVVAFAMREVFRADSPALAELMAELWEHSTEVATMAWLLAKRSGAIDPGEAQMAGLLHDIGVIPVLAHAAAHPEMCEHARVVLGLARRRRGAVGAHLLAEWRFPDAVVAAARDADDWWRDGPAEADLTDIVVVAQLLSFMGTPQFTSAPPVTRVPAFRRVFGPSFDESSMLYLLDEADDQVREVRALLRD